MSQYFERMTNIAKAIPKVKDSISLGIISGLLGTIILDLLSFINWRRKKIECLYGHMAASMLMKGFRTKKRSNFLFGEILHVINGAMSGIPLVYLFKTTGKDHPIIKGTAYGSLLWMIYYVLGKKSGIYSTSPRLNKSHKTTLWQNMVFGLATAKIIAWLADPSVFSTSSRIEQDQEKNKINPGVRDFPQHTDHPTEKPFH